MGVAVVCLQHSKGASEEENPDGYKMVQMTLESGRR